MQTARERGRPQADCLNADTTGVTASSGGNTAIVFLNMLKRVLVHAQPPTSVPCSMSLACLFSFRGAFQPISASPGSSDQCPAQSPRGALPGTPPLTSTDVPEDIPPPMRRASFAARLVHVIRESPTLDSPHREAAIPGSAAVEVAPALLQAQQVAWQPPSGPEPGPLLPGGTRAFGQTYVCCAIRLRSVSARCHLTACVVTPCLCLSPGCHLSPYAVRSRVVSHVVVRQSFMSLLLGSLLTSAASFEAAE